MDMIKRMYDTALYLISHVDCHAVMKCFCEGNASVLTNLAMHCDAVKRSLAFQKLHHDFLGRLQKIWEAWVMHNAMYV